MRLGQPFFKLNQNNKLNTFEEHPFEVIFILGVDASVERKAEITVSKTVSKISELNTIDRYSNETTIILDVDVDEFIKYNDSQQNSLLNSQLDFYENIEDLRPVHKTNATVEIAKERERLQQIENKLIEIERSLK